MTEALLTKLTVHRWTAATTDRAVSNEIHQLKDANTKAGRYVKNLIDRSAMRDIQTAANYMRTFHMYYTRPWDDTARRLLPSHMVDIHKHNIDKFRLQFQDAALVFAVEYPALIENAKTDLGAMFNPDDYPDPSQISGMFSVDVSYEPIPDGAQLPIGVPERNKMIAAIEQQTRETMKDSQDALFHRTVRALRDAHERITNYDAKMMAEQPTKFKSSVLVELVNFADILPGLNIENDEFLNGIAERMKTELSTIGVEDIKSSHSTRQDAIETLAEMAKQVEDHNV